MSGRGLTKALFRVGALHPFLREPIENMGRFEDQDASSIATDGTRLYYRPDAAIESMAMEHLLIHCLFRHMVVPKDAVRPLWDLACDISAEYLRAELFPGRDARRTQLIVMDALSENVDPRLPKAVYAALMNAFEDELEPLYQQFRRDDHRYWYAPPPENSPPTAKSGNGQRSYAEWIEASVERFWPSLSEWPGGMSLTGRWGLAPGSREERMRLREAGRYDFSRYLRRYATTKEEMRLDQGSFDLIPYYYGLQRYGNMPLIEPLEYAESHKVETLVVAIDTSGSCKPPTVARFLGEIQKSLMRHEYFFKRMNLRIIQCDSVIQSDVAIHSFEEWKDYLADITIRGRGGTDFRPVFKRVEGLMATGELTRLKGLLYFTDGEGPYPQAEPPYETAFVFATQKALEYSIPKWIVPLCLDNA